MAIKIENLKKILAGNEVLKEVNLKIEKGETVSIIGPSGSGKSTLLRCIVGLEKNDGGSITSSEKIEMGMIFQSFNLFPHKTALENIIESLIIVDKMGKNKAEEIGMKLLERVGLKEKKDSYPSELSGGQKQRVAIARALARSPKILLFDEPTSALDPEMVKEVLEVINELKKSKMTMIIVSHEMEFVKQISDKVIFMDEGKIILEGSSKEIFETNKNERVQKFLEKI
ncbi:MAG: amino acid ABC transporter ATP-binding protein [Fusobacteriaceae bacterium]